MEKPVEKEDQSPERESPLRELRRFLPLFETNYARRFARLTWMSTQIISSYYWIFSIRPRVFNKKPSRKEIKAIHRRNAKLFRRTAMELKGATIKIGQFLSLRVDILPREYIEEFSKLQDSVTPSPYEVIERTIVKEFGKPVDELFLEFEREAVAAASLAQVHRAKLKDGRIVAVKVQYPGLRRSVKADLAIGKQWLGYFAGKQKQLDLSKVFDEFENYLREELDFENEGKNIDAITKNLEDHKKIIIPKVYWELTSKKVLTLEYIDGYKILDKKALKAHNVDRKALVKVLVNAYAKQIFVDGFFHADPHPGNIFMQPPDKVVMLDFGMAKRLPPETFEALRKGLFAIFSGDPEGTIDCMLELGMLDNANLDNVRELTHIFFDKFHGLSPQQIKGFDFEGFAGEIRDLVLGIEGMQIPNDLILFGRAIGLLGSVSMQLDRDADIVAIAAPYLMNLFTPQKSREGATNEQRKEP